MQYEYAKNRIAGAIHELCTGAGDVRSRLLSAHSHIGTLVDNQIPSELLELWHEIHEMLTMHTPPANFEGKVLEGSVSYTLRKVKNVTGVKIAEKLYELHKNLQSNHQDI